MLLQIHPVRHERASVVNSGDWTVRSHPLTLFKMQATSDGGGDRPWQSYDTAYTNAKAGMDGIDKEEVRRIIYEMSKGSKYFENEQRKMAFVKQKVENMRVRCAKLTESDMSAFQITADRKIIELEASRDLSRIWLHVDMDAFYAAVEIITDPSLKGRPLAVGNLSMISTASYEARRFGVRAAMPGFIAKRLCPELLFVPPDFKKYTHFSDLTRKVFCKYDPHFLATSLDEAYLDITNVCQEKGFSGGEIADELRAAVHKETGLTCSAGVGPNRLLAKVCSDINKPNGQFILPNERMAVMAFISSLPTRKVGGIGKVTEHILRDVLGINTCEDLVSKSAHLYALFSSCSADFFLSVGLGLGATHTPYSRNRKSISCEKTFSATGDEVVLNRHLDDLAVNLSNDMEQEGIRGRTLTLKIKTASFEVRSRAVTFPKCIWLKKDILCQASKLLKSELPISLRLLGLRISHFRDANLDRAQKTLTGFVILGDSTLKVMDGQNSLESENGNICHMSEKDGALEASYHSTVVCDPADSSVLPVLNDEGCCVSSSKDAEIMLDDKVFHDEEYPTTVVDDHNMVTKESCGTEGREIVRIGLVSPKQYETDNFEIPSMTGTLDNGHDLSPSCNELPVWRDGYKCSFCGFELPPNFTEERRDHYDYHLAKNLQEEFDHRATGISHQQRSPSTT